ncbi:hypothetical protein OWM54_23850 [Myxococcus sp. MISCRS1]|uniref:hypothetical protein n=1 Tax=Myxococcus sp. MISCRS1 TaxID=2996786 RepID=UPI00226D8FF3|nr:hypothetical protein [Myxococcus sp. MISCRS1]MCY1000177.1 hypothetical protein [Myxococcus sp. MISCRS1]
MEPGAEKPGAVVLGAAALGAVVLGVEPGAVVLGAADQRCALMLGAAVLGAALQCGGVTFCVDEVGAEVSVAARPGVTALTTQRCAVMLGATVPGAAAQAGAVTPGVDAALPTALVVVAATDSMDSGLATQRRAVMFGETVHSGTELMRAPVAAMTSEEASLAQAGGLIPRPVRASADIRSRGLIVLLDYHDTGPWLESRQAVFFVPSWPRVGHPARHGGPHPQGLPRRRPLHPALE